MTQQRRSAPDLLVTHNGDFFAHLSRHARRRSTYLILISRKLREIYAAEGGRIYSCLPQLSKVVLLIIFETL
jgi:hypothetical protein